MRKAILGATFIAAFAFVAGYGAYASQYEVEMSDLAMANVEALAGGETSTSWTCTGYWGDCYDSVQCFASFSACLHRPD